MFAGSHCRDENRNNTLIIQYYDCIERFTDTHPRSVPKVETGQCAQSPAFALVVKPALRCKAGCVRKQVFIAADTVEVRLTVRLHSTQRPYVNVCTKSFTSCILRVHQWLRSEIFRNLEKVHYFVSLKQESRAVARKPRDAAAVLFDLKFADSIHYKFKSSQASKARLQSSKHTGAK